MKKGILLFFLFFNFFTSDLSAQSLPVGKAADSLRNLGSKMLNSAIEEERLSANYKFIKLFSATLRTDNAFSYPFKELDGIVSVQKSSDNKFRILTWLVPKDDGTFRYYGVIQLNNGVKSPLIPLIEDTDNLHTISPITAVEPNRWFGAVYYDIIPVSGKNPYYLLLGWKGKSPETSQKVIEVLTLKNNEAVLGAPVLESEAGSKVYYHRKVFSYDRQASMLLRYDKDEKLIVFDHLVAPSTDLAKSLETFVPDLSYDAYRFKNGKWVVLENVRLENRPNLNDDLFLDPTKIRPEDVPIRQY